MRKPARRDANERREDALRPSLYLGYDRDQLGSHLMRCQAFHLAQKQFERAVWLNPYEKGFQLHLAHCLSRQRKFDEAMEVLDALVKNHPDFREAEDLRKTIKGSVSDRGGNH